MEIFALPKSNALLRSETEPVSAVWGNQAKGNVEHSRLEYIKDWAARAKSASYNATALALNCCVSTRQLERFFQARMSNTPHKWLRELRMGFALELLQKGAPIKQVAQELCYKDSAHFCRDFKNYFGRTPGQQAAQAYALQYAEAPTLAGVEF